MLGRLANEEGQSTVEYLVVLLGVIAVAVGLAALLGAAGRGVFGDLATKAVSHATGGEDPAVAAEEVFLF